MTSLDFTSSFTLENVIRCCFRHICGSRGSQQTRLGHGSNGMCPCEGLGISSIEILISQVAVLSSTKKVVNITRNTQTLHDWHHGFFVEKPVVFTCFHQFLSISTSWSVEFLCCKPVRGHDLSQPGGFSFQPTLRWEPIMTRELLRMHQLKALGRKVESFGNVCNISMFVFSVNIIFMINSKPWDVQIHNDNLQSKILMGKKTGRHWRKS